MTSRRQFIVSGLGSVAAATLGCSWDRTREVFEPARLSSRLMAPTQQATLGLSTIDLGSFEQRCRLFVPQSYRPEQPLPLMLMFHGSGGRALSTIDSLREWAEHLEIIVVATDAFNGTWDALEGEFGTDILAADMALRAAFDRCAIDPRHVCVAGYSDGATYALGVGRANGDLFTQVAALAPGHLLEVHATGRPRFFVAHGVNDQVLPIERASRVIVPELRKRYDVEYHEFAGGHLIPDTVLDIAMGWIAGVPPLPLPVGYSVRIA
jgi:phospholipase/carboxylesterase